MAKSIIQQNMNFCFLCGKNGRGDYLEEHHIFGGADRKKSEKYGLKVRLCGDSCHRNGELSVHKNKDTAKRLKALAQQMAMERYGWNIEDFRGMFGKSYL